MQRHWLYEKAFEEAGVPLKRLHEECRAYSLAHLERFHGSKLDVATPYAKTRKDCLAELDALGGCSLEPPAKFSRVPEEQLRVMPPTLFIQKPDFYGTIVKDEEATTGEALCSQYPDPGYHGEGTIRKDPKGRWAFHATEFGYGDRPTVILKNLPKDEKYHWYKLPNVTLTAEGAFWGHFWYIHMPFASAYRVDDGVSDANRWDVWFRAKFTGPAYAPNSQQKNAVWCDLVVLVKPEAEQFVGE